ncbi:MAG: HEAT repeat domain-containing protein [Planctomycetota bacterium]
MHHRMLTCALGLFALLATETTLFAHGGIYRGPGDVVRPPGGSGRGPAAATGPRGPAAPRTGGPGSPSGPYPAGPGGTPTTGGGRPGAGSAAATGGRGIPMGDDLARWSFWWEFNKYGYLRLREQLSSAVITGSDTMWLGATRKKEAVDLLRPTALQIQSEVLPALKRALDSTTQRDIVSSCMMALAKIGTNHDTFELAETLRQRLSRDNQEIRETAALALGIAGLPDGNTLQLLCDLALDSKAARALAERTISVRTRSFAMYGIGLFCRQHDDVATKQTALATLQEVLRGTSRSNRNLKVAAIHALGQMSFDRDSASHKPVLDETIDTLLEYYGQDVGISERMVQSHCPAAITRLLGSDHERSDACKQRFAAELSGKSAKRRKSNDHHRSSALALGQLCGPHDDDKSVDASYSKLLLKTAVGHRDAQTRYFSLLALGQIGGKANRKALLRVLRTGQKSLERPWAAIALGVMEHTRQERVRTADDGAAAPVDNFVGEALHEQLKSAKNPELVGALGVAIGLCRYREAADTMQTRIANQPQKAEQCGYLCLGLAMTRAPGSKELIYQTMANSLRRPQLFTQAAVALGLLGDRQAAEVLHERLKGETRNLATIAAVASALGQIGDRRSIAPLRHMLFDDSLGDLQRAFSAVALGGVSDPALVPWHAHISRDTNYRAAVETLTNQVSGVLDIL